MCLSTRSINLLLFNCAKTLIYKNNSYMYFLTSPHSSVLVYTKSSNFDSTTLSHPFTLFSLAKFYLQQLIRNTQHATLSATFISTQIKPFSYKGNSPAITSENQAMNVFLIKWRSIYSKNTSS